MGNPVPPQGYGQTEFVIAREKTLAACEPPGGQTDACTPGGFVGLEAASHYQPSIMVLFNCCNSSVPFLNIL